MIILNLIIDTRRIKKDNTYPIVFRITYKSKYSDIQTGFSSAKNDSSFKLNNVKPSHPEYDFLYNKLKTDKVSYLSKIDLLGSNVGVELDTKQIRTFLLEKDIQPISVKSFWENEIQVLLNSNRIVNNDPKVWLSYNGKRHHVLNVETLVKLKEYKVAQKVVDTLTLLQLPQGDTFDLK